MSIRLLIRKITPKSVRYKRYCKAIKNRNRELMEEVLDYYKDTSDPEIAALMKFIKKNGIEWWNYSFKKKYIFREPVKIYNDEEANLRYLLHHGKRMYFKKSMNEKEIWSYYNNISMEQDLESPHCYLKGKTDQCKNKIVFDLGGAEGNFTLDIIDYIEHGYVFECDKEWIEALNWTFKDYRDKITIIPKTVAGKSGENTITLESVVKKFEVPRVDIIKMDIEGMEKEVIQGSEKLIQQHWPTMLICVYHNQNDYNDISCILSKWGYRFETPKGYFLWMNDSNLKAPWFRRCVLKAYFNQSETSYNKFD